VQYSSLESTIEASKDRYYLALRQTQGTIRNESPNWQPWIEYFLRALQQQAVRLRTKVDRERLLASALPELSRQILDHVQNHGHVTIGEMANLTGVSRNTLKEHFRSLVEHRHLMLHGAGRGSWYGLP
jgi:Fic family protein